MKRGSAAFLACLFVTSCSKPDDPPSGPSKKAPASSVLVIKVDGMQRGTGGKT